MKKLFEKNGLPLFLLAVILGFLTILPSYIRNDIPFWYDPARDLLSAQDNLHKITLIGPTSGIPGIFYGPYWIWLLSLAELISKNPAVIAFLVQTLPYFTVFPFLLYRMRKIWGVEVSTLLFLFFITSFKQYTLYLWNPHLAPLFLFIAFYLLSTFTSNNSFRIRCLKRGIMGVIIGLLLNFHISFGITVVVGFAAAILLSFLTLLRSKQLTKKSTFDYLILWGSFALGIAITFIPFFLFEMRHGFQQSHTALQALLSGGNVVSVKGLSQSQITDMFFGRIADLLSLPRFTGYVLIPLGLISGFYIAKKKKLQSFFSPNELLLLTFALSIFVALALIYQTARNPVWEYHFIGFEIVFLIFLGIALKKVTWLRHVVLIWAVVLTLFQIGKAWTPLINHSGGISDLSQKEMTVQTVQKDADNSNYSAYIYNPAIYSYDYSYLFSWLAKKDIPYRPELVPGNANPLYVIIPHPYEHQYPGFVRFRTPDGKYTTTREWQQPDGTRVIKREQK